MKMPIIAAAAALCLAATGTSAQTVELYGGMTTGGQQLNYGPVPPAVPNLVDMDSGLAFGAGVHWSLPNSFEIGIDTMLTGQDYTSWGPGGYLQTQSYMATGRYLFPVQNMTGYAGLGVGAITVDYSDTPALADGSDTIAGWQIEAGMRFQLGATPGFAAIKYQQGFDEALIATESVEYNSLSLIGGIRF